MCGRYGRRADKQRIAEWFHTHNTDVFNDEYYEINSTRLAPSYDISPDSIRPVARLDRDSGQRVLALMKWGLLPYCLLVEHDQGNFQLHQCTLRKARKQRCLTRAMEAPTLPHPSQLLLRMGAADQGGGKEEAQQAVGCFACG